jgi:hypothetical protein
MRIITEEQEISIHAMYNVCKRIIRESDSPELLGAMKFLKEGFFEKYFNEIIDNHDTSGNPSLSEGS